jgi:ABC-type polysaccharide/polyol phosphate transport system ATPase subunit
VSGPLVDVRDAYVGFKPERRGLFNLLPRRKPVTINASHTRLDRPFALEGISFQVSAGDRIGLIGNNGAGKSTLLRLLVGALQPVKGSVAMNGRFAGIFDLRAGIDTSATGYENIRLLAAMRGIRRRDLNALIGDVEEFSELGTALKSPVRTYSSGMRLRLAFAVATAAPSDVILMDEVVGVGDNTFRRKSRLRMAALLDNSGAVIIASHNARLLTEHCQRGLVLQDGKLVFDGTIKDALQIAGK